MFADHGSPVIGMATRLTADASRATAMATALTATPERGVPRDARRASHAGSFRRIAPSNPRGRGVPHPSAAERHPAGALPKAARPERGQGSFRRTARLRLFRQTARLQPSRQTACLKPFRRTAGPLA
ncbi:hypothetical protein GCM10009565_80820 [Amycolatopsis albidoflavus]